MSQPIRTLARTLLVPAALTAMIFAGQSAASASTLAHYRAPVGSAVASTSTTSQVHHFLVHFTAQPQRHVFMRWA
jgi:curli biogenesis system outer membrane secretion channel CsgG